MTQIPQLPYSEPAASEGGELIWGSDPVQTQVGTSSQGKHVRVSASFLLAASDQLSAETVFQRFTSTTPY